MGRFKPATREKSRLRLGLDGPSGAGKTYTALRFAFLLAELLEKQLRHVNNPRVAVVDTENGSASKYQGESPDGIPWDFDVLNLSNYAPSEYTSAMQEAGSAGYAVLVVDSLSHAWSGPGGALEIKDAQGGNQYTAWRVVTPMHNKMVHAILTAPCHVIATMRSKIEYVMEDDGHGKMVPRKVGMEPVQRAGMEYEFDVYGCLDWSHIMRVSKSRCSAVDGLSVVKPGESFLRPVIDWLEKGIPTPPKVSGEQVARIEGLIHELGISMSAARKGLAKHGVEEFVFLTESQADEIEKTLIATKIQRNNGNGTKSETKKEGV